MTIDNRVTVKRGTEINVDEAEAKRLILLGYAEEVKDEASAKTAPKNGTKKGK